MTATLIAMLVEGDRLSWSTRPTEVLRELRGSVHAAYREVTLANLLTHRAGLPGFTGLTRLTDVGELVGAGRWSRRVDERPLVDLRRDFAAWLLRRRPATRPGTFLYSNAGYTVAAAMAEATVGETWEQMLRTRLAGPLEIRLDHGWPGKDGEAQPWGHRKGLLQRRLVPQEPGVRDDILALLAPAGDVQASVSDYARFLQMHLRGLLGRDALLRASTVHRLHRPEGDYTLGWVVQGSGGATFSGHEGSAGTFYVSATASPTSGIAAAVFCNAGGAEAEEACREANVSLLRRHGALN